MKQKLLYSFKLRAIMLVAMFCASLTGAWADTTSGSSTLTWSEQSLENSTSVDGTSYNVGDYFTVTCSKNGASTAPTYYTSGTAVRCYATKSTTNGNIITVARKAGIDNVFITSVAYNGDHNKKGTTSFSYSGSPSETTATSATYEEDDEVTTASATLCETGGSANGQFYFSSVTVDYIIVTDGPTTYSVTYNANEATSGTVPTDATAYTSGATVTVAGNTGSLAKTGYTFGGWCMNAAGTGTIYGPDNTTTFEITATTTLYAKWNAKTITGLTKAGTPTKTTYAGGENFDPTGLTVTATYNDDSEEDVTASVTWTPSPLTAGTTEVTGTYMGLTVTVTGLTVTAAPGSDAEHAYTVAQALAASASSGVYVRGIVSSVASTSLTSNGQIRYYISDDGTTTSQMNIYNGLGINGAQFSSINDLQVGDEVVITGDISVYQNANQFNANNQLVSLKLVAPTFSKAAGELQSGTGVEIEDLHTDATIYYTTNGDNPTTSSSVYSTAIVVSEDMTIKAIAVKDGYTTSDVAAVSFTVVAPVPSITITAATPVNVIADGDSNELELSYENFVVNNASDFAVQFYDENDDEVSQPDWIDVEVEDADPSGYEVVYAVYDNAGEARTTYFKVFADAGADFVYSNKVTITQAAYVAPPTPNNWVAANLADINANDVFVIVGNDGSSTYAMSNDNGTTKGPDAAEITVSGSRLVGEIADSIQWNLGGNASDGYTFYPNGSTTTWLYCNTTAASSSNNNMRVGTGARKVFEMNNDGYLLTKDDNVDRYVSIYSGSDWRGYINTTTAPTTLAFYKQLAAKLNSEGYATFSATVPVDFTDDSEFSAWVIKSITGTAITFEQVTGTVPANTGVLLKGEAGETVYPVAAASGTAPKTNLLTAVANATTITDGQYYGLSGASFVKVNAGTVPAGKALLPASEVSAGVKSFTFVFNGADGIQTIENGQWTMDNEVIYNLAGQRLSKMQRGINIVNGKKVFIK